MNWRTGLPLFRPLADCNRCRPAILVWLPRLDRAPATGELAASSVIQRRSLNVSDNREIRAWDTHRHAF